MSKLTRWFVGLFLLLIALILLFGDGNTGAGLLFLGLAYWCLPIKKGDKKVKHEWGAPGETLPAAPRTENADYVFTFSANEGMYNASERSDGKPQKTNAKWIKPGEAVTIGEKAITSGYIYVGRHLPAAISQDSMWSARNASDPALINPKLPVAKSNPDTSGQYMNYWPSYADIKPSSRLAYLEWLADGKKDPRASIGYVFLYFYGLERRIVGDLPPDAEIRELMEEVKRLRSIYNGSRSFDRYSNGLLDAARFIMDSRNIKSLEDAQPNLEPPSEEKESSLRMALSYQLQKGDPLSFEWAMVGYFYVIRRGDRATVRKAFPQFIALMRKRFEKKWPNGMKMRKQGSPYHYPYMGASQYLKVDLAKYLSLPALCSPESANWEKLIEMGGQVESELSAYAKAAGRNPERADSLETLLLLPTDLADDRIDKISEFLVPWLSKIASPLGGVAVEQLVELVTKEKPESIDQKKLRSVATILEKFGYGMEPDPDFHRARIKPDEKVFLFDARSLKDLRQSPSNAYKLAMPLATILAAVGGSSENGMGEEEKRWVDWIQKTLNLSEVEARRLRAHLEWLEGQKLTSAKVKNAIAEIPGEQRGTIAHFAAAVAYADGIIEKSEIAFLEKVYDELGVERKQLYATLHDMSTERAVAAAEPVTVENAAVAGTGYKIQTPPPELKTKKKGKKGLDHAKIDQILADTKQVSTMLADIFKEEEATHIAPAANANTAVTSGIFAGLDANHASLATHLSEQKEWERAEFEKMAKDLGLMPNGALEVINEWAFDKFDEPLIEDGDKIEVNLALVG